MRSPLTRLWSGRRRFLNAILELGIKERDARYINLFLWNSDLTIFQYTRTHLFMHCSNLDSELFIWKPSFFEHSSRPPFLDCIHSQRCIIHDQSPQRTPPATQVSFQHFTKNPFPLLHSSSYTVSSPQAAPPTPGADLQNSPIPASGFSGKCRASRQFSPRIVVSRT